MAVDGRTSGSGASVPDEWLRRCEGYRVDSPHGRVGFIEELRFASSTGRPDALAIRAGLLGWLLLVVPVENIDAIVPSEQRIALRRTPRPRAVERLCGLSQRALGGSHPETVKGR